MLAPSRCGLCPLANRVNDSPRGSAGVTSKELLRQRSFGALDAVVVLHRHCAVKRENDVVWRVLYWHYNEAVQRIWTAIRCRLDRSSARWGQQRYTCLLGRRPAGGARREICAGRGDNPCRGGQWCIEKIVVIEVVHGHFANPFENSTPKPSSARTGRDGERSTIEEVAAQRAQPRERALSRRRRRAGYSKVKTAYISTRSCAAWLIFSVLLISTSRLTSSHSCKLGDNSAEN